MAKFILLLSFIWSVSPLFGQPPLDISNVEHVNVFNSDTSVTKNATAYVSYFKSPDSCINLFKSNHVHDFDTLFVSKKKDLIIYRYENNRLLINYSTNNPEALTYRGLLYEPLDSISYIIYQSPASNLNKKHDKSFLLFDCNIDYSPTFISDWKIEKDRLDLIKIIKSE